MLYLHYNIKSTSYFFSFCWFYRILTHWFFNTHNFTYHYNFFIINFIKVFFFSRYFVSFLLDYQLPLRSTFNLKSSFLPRTISHSNHNSSFLKNHPTTIQASWILGPRTQRTYYPKITCDSINFVSLNLLIWFLNWFSVSFCGRRLEAKILEN